MLVVMVHVKDEAGGQAWLTGEGVSFPAIHDEGWTIWNQYATGDYFTPQAFGIHRDMVIHHAQLHEPWELYSETQMVGHILDAVYDRLPVDLEMVMDVSGSMNSPAVGDSKLTMMKRATTMVTDFVADYGQPNDHMGLVWFTDDAVEYQDTTGEKLLSLPARSAELKTQIAAHTTGSCTAMGAGLQMAYNTLTGSAQQKAIVLCTDGMQNIEPRVTKVDDHYEIRDGGSGLCGPHSTIPEAPGVDITSHDTVVNTIGIGITATYEPLLQEIADQTGGVYLGTDDPASDLDLLYFVDLCNSLAGGSPTLLHHNVGTLETEHGEASETFALNRSVRKFTTLLSWPKSMSGGMTFWLYSPDGQVLDLSAMMKSDDDYCMATVYLPQGADGSSVVDSVGTWRMVIKGESTEPISDYHAFVIAEDRDVHWLLNYPRKHYEVGDHLPISVVLREKGNLVTRVRDLVVESAAARVPTSELLARVKMPPSNTALRTIGSQEFKRDSLALRLEALTNDPDLSSLVKPSRRKMSIGEGTLPCTFGDSSVTLNMPLTTPGLNSFKVSISAETETNGPLTRTSVVTVHVRPGKPDPERSKVGLIDISRRNLKGTLFSVTPRTAVGHLIGPGASRSFSVMSGTQRLDTQVDDLVDGTYQVLIPRSAGEAARDKAVRIVVDGVTLWRGNI